jgi:hypothetical protein
MSDIMHTESFSCFSRAPGASQADGQNNGEDRQQSQAALQLEDKGLELVKFNKNMYPSMLRCPLLLLRGILSCKEL